MVSRAAGVTRAGRGGESGFTLIEVLVSIAILAIIGGALAAVFSVGLATLRPGGPQTRLLGAHDLMVLEAALGRDGARAACIQVPGGARYGSCVNGFTKVNCSANDLCFGWPQADSPQAPESSCHAAVYIAGSSTTATRTEYTVSSGTVSVVTSDLLAREEPVSLQVGNVVSPPPPGESYPWVRSLPITITAAGVTKGPSQTLELHPVATDPAGASAAITGRPC